MITAPITSGRQLCVGEGQRPNLLTWFITLNGVSMATDMAQRSVLIKVVRGKNDSPWWEQTRQFIGQHRGEIIADIIAALRGEPYPLAEFPRWATWEQHVFCRLNCVFTAKAETTPLAPRYTACCLDARARCMLSSTAWLPAAVA
jgi:hypothetical protein